MVVRAIFACLFFALVAGTPLREPNGYGYDVKHPGGSSRVHVRSGGEIDRNKDYISDATYANPHYARPHYEPNSYGSYNGGYNDQGPYHGHSRGRVPVYVERSSYPKRAVYQQVSPHDQFSAYGQNPHEIYPQGGHVISQSAVDAGPFYEKPAVKTSFDPGYSNPRFVQQAAVEDANYFPNKLEQVSLEQKPSHGQVFEKYPADKVAVVPAKPVVVQQVVSDDLHEPGSYPDTQISQIPLVNDPSPPVHVQSPIDQQILVDEPKETPILSQKTLDEKPPLLSQVPLDVPSTKSVPVIAKTPIVQQSSLDDFPPSSLVQYMNDDEVSQVAVDAKPSFDKSPVVQQQVSIDDKDYGKGGLVQENINPVLDEIVIGKSHGGPVVQTAIEEHPSQAVYDSSIEPSFSDIDHNLPPYSVGEQPKYRFIPSGPPYEKISHSTEIIHGPPRSHYPNASPQKHIEPDFSTVKGSPSLHSVKLPPPPVTKTVIPAQEHVDSDILLTKNPPLSVKLPPPPPVTKSIVQQEIPYAQEHVEPDILFKKKLPISQSVKLPPPAPVTKTVVPVALPEAQEHVDADIILTKNPPPSVKLPPPPPVSQSVKLPPPPPVYQSVKLPPPPPPVSQSVKLPPPVSQSVKLPPPPPVYQSVKRPPPPPVYQSVKLPPPPPVYQSVKLPPPPPAYQSVKRPPPPPVYQSVKRPPPQPVYQSVKLPPPVYKPLKPIPSVKRPYYGYKSPGPSHVKLLPPPPHWNKPHHIHFTKNPSPPLSVKRPYGPPPVLGNPYLKQRVKVPVTKTSPVSHRVKVPLVSNVHSVKHPKATYVPKGPPSVKTPPLAPTLLVPASVKGGSSYPQAVKKPYPSIVEAHSEPYVGKPDLNYPSHDAPPSGAYLPISHDAPPSGEYLPISHDAPPSEEYLPISHGAPHPYPTPDEVSLEAPPLVAPEAKSPFEKYAPVSHAVRLPTLPKPKAESLSATNVGDRSSGIVESSPFDKYPRVSHAIRLPGVLPATTTSVPNLFAAVPLKDSHDDGTSAVLLEPGSESHVPAPKSDSLIISPLSHSVRLPVSVHGSSRGHIAEDDYDQPRQDFPAFPVESALKQRDPVSEKVAGLTNSFNDRGASYLESGHEPDDDESPRAQSINDAKSEIARVNKEIGVSFGDRIHRRSRFS